MCFSSLEPKEPDHSESVNPQQIGTKVGQKYREREQRGHSAPVKAGVKRSGHLLGYQAMIRDTMF